MIDAIFAAKMPSEDKEILTKLMASAREGHLCLDIGDAPFDICPGIRREKNFLYLERNWVYETKAIEQLRRLSHPLAPSSYCSSELTDEQNEAVRCALSHSISIITGGPGTGKTFVARHLIEAMGEKARIVLAAPTGKAVSRLKELNPNAQAGTLHTLLNIRSGRDLLSEGSYLSADLIIVDESSMIDARLFGFFLSSVPAGCRIVFLGDADQLPPVESGSLFADLVGLLPTARLKKCMRSDRKEILDLAQAVLEGGPIEPHASSCDVEKEAQDGWRILSCVRGGPWGVDTLNRQLAQNAGSEIPILITKNDPDLGLYNGDTGVLDRLQGIARFSSDKMVAAALLPPHEPAYCLSVHKSQGSEFDRVLVLVPPGSEVFGREILYTAVTRAKKEVKLIGDPQIVQSAVGRSSRRISGLKQRWEALEG